MAKTNAHELPPSRLADLLRMPLEPEPVWKPEDLEKILKGQLTAPIEFDLTALRPETANKLATAAAAQGLLVRSLQDLLGHPNPPLELLKMLKRFAKAGREQPDSPIPREVATVIYFASAAAGLARHGSRIADLDDAALREGLTWVGQQTWVDGATRSLVQEALRLLPI